MKPPKSIFGFLVIIGMALGACGPASSEPTDNAPKGIELPQCAEFWGGEGNGSCQSCGCDASGWSCAISTCMSPAGTVRKLGQEAGFFTISPYKFQGKHPGLRGEMTETRIFYAFQPADDAPADKPLFVFFNGGPGAATMDILFSFNTSQRTLDTPADATPQWKDNPNSFTKLGNVLYVDTRDTGFSYNLRASGGQQAGALHAGTDAADVLRVILRFLDRHEPLVDNHVVIVGESWGGARSNMIMSMVRKYQDLRSEEGEYQDPALADEIESHFSLAFQDVSGKDIPAEVILRQFSWQVLIQPALLGKMQADAQEAMRKTLPIVDLEEEIARMDRVSGLMQSYQVVREMLGVDPAEIRDMRAEQRTRSDRSRCEGKKSESWAKAVGLVNYGHDCYFSSLATLDLDAYDAYAVPMAFLGNLGRVNTFITNSTLDRTVLTPVIFDVLRTQDKMFDAVEELSTPGEPRNTRVHLAITEATSTFYGIPRDVWIAFPGYESGHSVPMYQPSEFFADVQNWISETGADK